MTENDYLSWTRPTAILKCLGARATRHQYLLLLNAIWRRRLDCQDSLSEMEAANLLEKVCFDELPVEALLQAGEKELHEYTVDVLSRAGFSGSDVIQLVEYARQRTLESPDHPDQVRREKLAQTNLLRCIVGNPYTPTGVDPAWLRWNDGAVPRLAETIHCERRFDELPVLADALEEAGCEDSDILGHCRTRREHALGCWVLSLLRSRLAVRLVLSDPEARLSGWRPDMAELENVSAEPVTIAYRHGPFERLGLLTLDASGEVIDHQAGLFADSSWAPNQTIALGPGGTLRHHLGPTRTLPPGIYTMQALFRHGGIDLRSRAFLFTVPTQG